MDGQAGAQPTTEDVDRAMAFLREVDEVGLARADDDGRRCGRCHFFMDPAQPISLCWHAALRTGVDAGWRCDHFEAAPTA